MPAARKPGRPAIGERALVAQVFARLTSQQHDRYLALGGAKWLRQQLDLAEVRKRLTPEPTAHNPFPPCRLDQHPGDKGGPSGY